MINKFAADLRKIVICIPAFLLIAVFLLPTAAKADITPGLTIPDQTVDNTSQITVPITANGFDPILNIAHLEFRVNFASAQMNYSTFVPNPAIYPSPQVNTQSGYLIVTWNQEEGTPLVLNDVLLSLVFNLTNSGTFDASFNFTDVTVTDNNFQPIVVTSTDGFVKVNPLKNIVAFSFAGLGTGVINEVLHTIDVLVPYGTNLTNLVPTIEFAGVSIDPVSGQAQDFTNPVNYTVTAEGGSTQTYVITVVWDSDPVAVVFDAMANNLNANGIVNNLSDVTSLNVSNFSGLYFEKSIGGQKMGRITFNSALNLSSEDTKAFLQAIGAKMDANTTGVIGLDLTGAADSVALKNAPATIKFYGLDKLGFGSETTSSEVNAKLVALDDQGKVVDKSWLIPNGGTYVGACGVGEIECYIFTVGVNHFTKYEIDTIAPVIALNGENPINVYVGQSYTDAGVTTTDNVDSTVPVYTWGSVNTDIVGAYIIKYTATDTAGNQAQEVTRTVNVLPVPSSDKAIVAFSFAGLGTGIIDQENHQITVNVPFGANVTALIPTIEFIGVSISPASSIAQNFTNSINYTVVAADNSFQNYTVKVIIVEPSNATAPVITLIGNAIIDLVVGDTYTDAGATALDNVDGDITAKIVIVNSVNTATAGTYTITYNVSDAAGNAASQITRTIIVHGEETEAVALPTIGGGEISQITEHSANFAWNWPGDSNIQFTLKQSTDGMQSFSTVAQISAVVNQTDYQYTFDQLTPNTNYWFEVATVDNIGYQSGLGNTVPSVTLASVPGNVQAVADGPTQITVSWTGDATSYEVMNVIPDNSTVQTTSLTFQQFVDLTCNTQYTFSITALNSAAVANATSALVSASTQSCPSQGGGGDTQGGVSEQEYNALVALYNSTGSDNWTNHTGWLDPNVPVSEWYGVTVEDGKVTSLLLFGNGLSGALPPEIGNLSNLTSLDVDENEISFLPAELGNLVNLRTLFVGGNNLQAIPSTIGNLTNLERLSIYKDNIPSLPSEIKNLLNLKSLDYAGNNLENFPLEVLDIPNLEELTIGFNKLTSIPAEITKLSRLESLSVRFNNIDSLPAEISGLKNLKVLDLFGNKLGKVPNEVLSLTSLEQLNLGLNGISSFPAEIIELVNLKDLWLYGNGLQEFPIEILGLTNLESLNVAYNWNISSVPETITQLSNLKYLDVRGNSLTVLPDSILNLNKLDGLWIKDNKLDFSSMEKIMSSMPLSQFEYSPQQNFSVEPNEVKLTIGDTLSLNVTVGGTANKYQWFKDGIAVSEVSSDLKYVKENIATEDFGEYTCQVTNDIVPGLTLASTLIEVKEAVSSVSDTIAPVITLLGDATVNLIVGDTYTDAGATAIDNIDGSIAVQTTGSVDTAVIGDYTITYTATDAANNNATASRTIYVVAAPVTLSSIAITTPAIKLSYTVGDVLDITGLVVTRIYSDGSTKIETITTANVSGFNSSTPVVGQVLTITVDGKTTTYTVDIVAAPDTIAPVIALLGDATVNLIVGDTYTDAGATASDNIDGDLTAKIVIVNSVNTVVAGTYTVTYNVSDTAGNQAAPVNRTVVISAAPIIIPPVSAPRGGGGNFIFPIVLSIPPTPSVIVEVVKTIPTQAVLGEKVYNYANGVLLRASDYKIYVMTDQKLNHILNLQELAKYAGRETIKVSDEVIIYYGQTVAVPKVIGAKAVNSIDNLIAGVKYGQRSDKVRQLQTELKKLGFLPKWYKVTNYYGPITSQGVQKYQAGR